MWPVTIPSQIAPSRVAAIACTQLDFIVSGSGRGVKRRPSLKAAPPCVPTQRRPAVSNAIALMVLWGMPSSTPKARIDGTRARDGPI
jgi:hypothetical protein